MREERPASRDVAIVGGGPAGLAAALTAGRMHRRAIVFQAGIPRAAHAPCYHNYLGFPDGIAGEELLARGRAHAERWGAEIVEAAVTGIERRDTDPRFVLDTTEGSFQARGLVLATGVKDRQLRCGDLYSDTGKGVHYCVVCDAREALGERVAVVGSDESAFGMICVLRDFTDDLWLLLDGEEPTLNAEQLSLLDRWEVHIVPDALVAYAADSEGVEFTTEDGRRLPFPHVFIARGTTPRTELAEALGCALDDDGYIVTDESQATSIPYVYAAGDGDGGHKQVTQAMAEGELAVLELIAKIRLDEMDRG